MANSASLAKWFSVRLQIALLWVQVPLQSLNGLFFILCISGQNLYLQNLLTQELNNILTHFSPMSHFYTP